MKKTFYFLVSLLVISALFNSCTKDEFDEALLYAGSGKWRTGTLYYKYLSNGNGSTWDTKDDVTEDEAQPFTWTLVKSELRQIHIMTMGGNIPKTYTVTKLTASTLEYKDAVDGGRSYSFSKAD